MKIKLSHSLKEIVGLLSVGLGVRGGNKEVIHVDDKLSFSDYVSEHIIHEVLERCNGVIKAKEHDSGFKESFVGDEGHFPVVTGFDADIVVSPMNIEPSEVMSVF